MNVPLDDLHEACMAARADIRSWFRAAQLAAAQWVPAPVPSGPRRAASAGPDDGS